METTGLTMPELIRRYAEIQPEKTALIISERKYSYRELNRRIEHAAAVLASMGVGGGTHVVTVASPEIGYIACEYAILGLGAVNIPTENRIPQERLKTIADAVDAEIVLSPERPDPEVKWASYSLIEEKQTEKYSWNPVGLSDACSEIIFTTGTTGKSKGVMLSSHCLDVYLSAINPSFGLKNDSVFLATTPLNHVGGLHRIHQCVSVGCTAVLLDGIRNLKAFFNAVHSYGVTHTYLPPASVKMLITLAKRELAALDGKLEFVYTASAPFPSADIETFMSLLPHTRLHQGYGSSETGSICNCQYNAPGETINSLGKPYPCVEVILEDEDGNRITEAGKAGFIRSRSGMNMLGYYGEPELTASVLKEGFIYSKDRLFFDGNGELHFAGRGDDVINVNGFKISPTEVEDVCLHFEKVSECVCIPWDDRNLGRVMKMFVVRKPGICLEQAELFSWLSGRLEPYKLPKFIEFLTEIPKTYNGKIDRKSLLQS